MTREELKRHCKKQVENCEMWAKCKGEEPHGKVYEEHKLILELLEQEPCEDAISRQAVINGIDNYIEKVQSTGAKDDFISFEELVVKALPPVTPQPKTGHWISHKEHCENLGVMPSGLGAYKWCSNCDCGIDVMEWHRTDYNYCPNCGTKMESEE